uniref:Plastocyanin/azurin family copper binding protein n=1 Tax=Marseillevirus LCMAC202 TaxID=2506606 RepID=A0A481YXE5_9VIRU|nr:MAG: plastocyanin/azurin family copper binding protein [Marseillevirus LCMAC202]
MNVFIIVFIALFIVITWFCWGTTERYSLRHVSIQEVSFKPADITIKVGDTVMWTNKDQIWHTATSGEPFSPNDIFNSGRLNSSDTFKYSFKKAGVYPYYCIPHPWMTGTITVK